MRVWVQAIGLEFGMGAAAALLIACFPVGLALRKSTCLLVAGLITFLFFKLYESFVLHQDFSISIAVWLFGVSAASMIAGLALLDLRGHIRLPPIFRLLGAASFSVYLVNYSAIVMAVKAMQLAGIPIGNNLAALTLAGMAISCGLLFHFFVDQPLQRELRSTKALRLTRA